MRKAEEIYRKVVTEVEEEKPSKTACNYEIVIMKPIILMILYSNLNIENKFKMPNVKEVGSANIQDG